MTVTNKREFHMKHLLVVAAATAAIGLGQKLNLSPVVACTLMGVTIAFMRRVADRLYGQKT